MLWQPMAWFRKRGPGAAGEDEPNGEGNDRHCQTRGYPKQQVYGDEQTKQEAEFNEMAMI